MPLNPALTDWRGRRVWIIGASSGIGAATARLFLEKGARVALSARSREPLAALAAIAPDRALALPLDARQDEEIAAALREIVARWGGLDLVLFCAGTYSPMRAWSLDGAKATEMVQLNLVSVISGLREVMPQLLSQGGGAIALVASVAGYRGLPGALVYGATKAALINLAETLYLDLAPRGIAVYLVNPGFVKTPLTDRNTFRMPALVSAEEAAREIARGIEGGRFEIHFPRRFTLALRLARLLPYSLYFRLAHRATGL
ncbi:MAG TPA: SDR family NAD(P)-dependent oxidoreductase [Burkholderiales bacterium]|nr:SDR family NAD(P)-dependent oxidoreductase [Burkholderiales bacterium]